VTAVLDEKVGATSRNAGLCCEAGRSATQRWSLAESGAHHATVAFRAKIRTPPRNGGLGRKLVALVCKVAVCRKLVTTACNRGVW